MLIRILNGYEPLAIRTEFQQMLLRSSEPKLAITASLMPFSERREIIVRSVARFNKRGWPAKIFCKNVRLLGSQVANKFLKWKSMEDSLAKIAHRLS